MKLREVIWEQKKYADVAVKINNHVFKLHKYIIGVTHFPSYVTDLHNIPYSQSAINTAFAVSYDVIDIMKLPFDKLIATIHLRGKLGLPINYDITAKIRMNAPTYYTTNKSLPYNDYALGIYGIRIWDKLNYTLTPKQALYATNMIRNNVVKYQILCAAYFRTGNVPESHIYNAETMRYIRLIQSDDLKPV